MHFLCLRDLSKLLSRLIDNWKSGSGILTVVDDFGHRFSDLRDKLLALKQGAKVDFSGQGTHNEVAANNKALRNEYGWFAKIKVKSVKMSSYPEDGYDVEYLLLEYSWDGDDETVEVELDFIGYEEADDELEEDPKMFTYEKDDDVDIELPDSEGTFTGVAKKDFDIIASMDTKVNNSVLNKYPNAYIRFFNGNGAKFPVSKGKLTIYADSDEYCYEVNSNGDYIDLSDTYSSKDKGFVITTTTLGKYIVSDAALRGAVSSGSTAAPAPSAPSTAPSTNTTYPVTSPIISNPNTGVWEG